MAENKDGVRIAVVVTPKGKTRTRKTTLYVAPFLEEAVEDIRSFLKSLVIEEPYMVLLNGTSVQAMLHANKRYRIAEGDLFSVMPIVSGG